MLKTPSIREIKLKIKHIEEFAGRYASELSLGRFEGAGDIREVST